MYLPNSFNISTFGYYTQPLLSGLISTFGYSEYSGVPDDFINDLVLRSQNLLIEQFEESQAINDFISIFVNPLQECERILSELQKCRDLDNMSGDRLDIAGEIIGPERGTLNDDDYRTLIKLYIYLNKSSGEPETLITALRFFTQAERVHYHELHPAKVLMQFTTIFPLPGNLLGLIQRLAMGGVKVLLEWSNDTDLDFGFDGEGAYPPDPDTDGFTEEDYTPIIGGKLIEELY